MAKQTPNGFTKLDPKVWRDDVNALVAAQATKREADAAARTADQAIKGLVAKFTKAMGEATAALCGGAVLTRKTRAGAEATLTTVDGERIPWADVASVTIGGGNRVLKREEIAALFGGRGESIGLDVAGTVGE